MLLLIRPWESSNRTKVEDCKRCKENAGRMSRISVLLYQARSCIFLYDQRQRVCRLSYALYKIDLSWAWQNMGIYICFDYFQQFDDRNFDVIRLWWLTHQSCNKYCFIVQVLRIYPFLTFGICYLKQFCKSHVLF